MSYLKESLERRPTNVNIAPPKSLQLSAEMLVPSASEFVQSTIPLSAMILENLSGRVITDHIRYNKGTGRVTSDEIRKVTTASAKWDPFFIRWDEMRRQANTGFEGYGAGSFSSAQDIAEAIAKMGVDILMGLKRDDPSGKLLKSAWETVMGVKYDSRVALRLFGSFGSLIGRLRAETSGIAQVSGVRGVLSRSTVARSRIDYDVERIAGGVLDQTYTLPKFHSVRDQLSHLMPVENVNPSIFNGRPEYYGYLFMMRLGIMGHPLVRESIS